eukprot:193261_1
MSYLCNYDLNVNNNQQHILAMGLFDFLFQRFFKKNVVKCRILILGLDNAGKTSCLKRFSDEEIDHIMPTQGFNIKHLQQQGFEATIWDLGGQRAIRTYWRNYYDNSDGIIFVIDSSDKRRMEEVGLELLNLLKEAKLLTVPLLILANKQDLSHALTIKDISEQLLLSNVRDRPWSIQPCSAKSGEGLKDGLMWIMQTIKSNTK